MRGAVKGVLQNTAARPLYLSGKRLPKREMSRRRLLFAPGRDIIKPLKRERLRGMKQKEASPPFLPLPMT